MKKLLSLLSALTISGAAIPTTIAASPYQKENLIRKKRDNWYGWIYINFYGISDILKGTLSLDTTNKKIRLGGLGDYRVVHSNEVNQVYNKIIIKNNNGDVIKEILYWKDISIQRKLEIENLLNGIPYNNDYTIEIWSNEPWRTKFNDHNDVWKSFSENTLYFKIKNDRIYKLNSIKEFIINTNIGALDNNNVSTIKAAVKTKNPSLDTSEVDVSQITSTSADIDGSPHYSSNKYKDYKKVYFTVKPDLIIDFKTCIDPVDDTSDATILSAIKTKNPSLDISQVYVKQKVVGRILELGVKSNSNKYNTNSSRYCDNFKVRTDLNKNILTFNLNIITNDNNAILNELNYLNHNLDISQLEVTNKTTKSATIKAKSNSNKYFGEKKIYYAIDNEQNKIINLNELIEKGIFLNFRDKNKENIVKEIKNINTDNLIYSNVIASKSIEPIINKNKENICSGKTILENNLSTEQKLKTSNCKYTIQEVKSFQITTGLSKTTGLQTNSEVSSGSTSSSSSTTGLQTGHSQSNSSTNSSEVGGSAGFNLFGFSIGGSASSSHQKTSASETSSLTMYNSTQEISKSFSNSFSKSISLSNSFDLGNSQEKQSIKIFELELPFQELNVEGNQKIEVSTFLDKVLAQVTLNLKQDIYGEINSEIINENNEKTIFKISIKEIMQKLKQYYLLPQEVTINDDDSITFNGKANLSYQFYTIGETSTREIETF